MANLNKDTAASGIQHGSPRNTFERLYTHHTVASLAQRIDFDVSMLDQKKNFVSPLNRRRRNSIGTSNPATTVTNVTEDRTRSSSLTRLNTKKAKIEPPRRSTAEVSEVSTPEIAQQQETEPSPSNAPASAASPNNKKRASKKKKVNYGGSLSRMFAANSSSTGTDKSASSAVMSDVDSKASTVQVENTSNNPPSRYSSLSVDVEESDVAPATGDLMGAAGVSEEDDLLNTLLDSSGGNLAETGAYGLNEEDELVFDNQSDADDGPGTDLEEQEAAMAQALERAVEEFETAAAANVSLFDGDEAAGGGEGGELDDDGVGELLAAAAKTVATVEESDDE